VRTSSTPLPAEVDAIFELRCRECHTEPLMQFAPMPLLDWEDVQAPRGGEAGASPIYALIRARINDPMYPMPPVTRPPLAEEERATLNAWIADCAPAAPDF
jgi:hypothetical protein